ncbi:zinc finger protein 91-like [Saccostrea echinata]|uniref:zinc finger protein 91-like n=1 Tax=Saccostrea echinata TaxID=191078 RepID=UPI002A7FD111|nr:zinc finger protein 91-like [Saccostrea echinata]
MANIFANVWVEISPHCINKVSNFVNADRYLAKICKITGTQIVNMFDKTAIQGQWHQILMLHRLLAKKWNKKAIRSDVLSKLLLQKYKIQRENQNLTAFNEHAKTKGVFTVNELNRVEISYKSKQKKDGSLEEECVTLSNKNDHLFEESCEDQAIAASVSVLNFQHVDAKDTDISADNSETLQGTFEGVDSVSGDIDAADIILPAETKINKQLQNEKTPSNFKCSLCEFKSNHKNSVRDHELRVHFALPEKCKLCEKVFSSHQHLKRHMLSHKNSKLICDVCGKMYKSTRTLKKHKKLHSIGYEIPELECIHCKKSFTSKTSLENHIETQHAGKKSAFLCPTCGKVFTRKYSLKQHQLVHTGSRLVCDVCQKSFSSESSLRDHRNIHTDLKSYKCQICSKTFNQRTTLQKHSKIHSADKSFKCLECGRGFTQKQALQRHERSHKGIKPFTCKICQKSYGDAAIIRKHLIVVHKIHKDSMHWKEDIIQNEDDNSFDTGYNTCNTSHTERNETQIPTYGSYEGNVMIHTENLNEMQISLTTEHNTKPVPALPEDLSMSSQEVHQIQSQMHQLPLSMYQHSQTLYNEHVDPTGVDPSVYPSQHDLNSVSTYPYLSSAQGQPDQNLENNHTSTNPYLASTQPTSAENMEENPASSHPYLPTQHPPPHDEDHSSSHQYNDSILDMSGTPRPEGLTSKRLPDADAAENLSLSTLYAYYSSLASQYLNMSGYPGYTQPSEEQQQSQQNV